MARYSDLSGYTADELAIWDKLLPFEGETLYTYTGLEFSFRFKRYKNGNVGNEIELIGKNRRISRRGLTNAYRLVKASQAPITAPKDMGVAYASYVLPLLVAVGAVDKSVIENGGARRRKRAAPCKTPSQIADEMNAQFEVERAIAHKSKQEYIEAEIERLESLSDDIVKDQGEL